MTITVDFDEIEGSPNYKLDRKSLLAQRILKIAWSDVEQMFEDIFPASSSGGTEVIQNLPDTFPGKPALFASQLNIVPFDGDNPGIKDTNTELATYPTAGARVTIDYTPLEGSDFGGPDEPQTFFTQRITASGEFLKFPPQGFDMNSSGNDCTEDVPLTKVIPIFDHVLTWSFVNNPPFSTWRTRMGTVNNGSFLGAAFETLLFMGANASRETKFDGTRPWSVEYQFSEKILRRGGSTFGWNHVYDPEGKAMDKPKDKTSGDFLYDTSDFSALFLSG